MAAFGKPVQLFCCSYSLGATPDAELAALLATGASDLM
jgi:hypothetical protein